MWLTHQRETFNLVKRSTKLRSSILERLQSAFWKMSSYISSFSS